VSVTVFLEMLRIRAIARVTLPFTVSSNIFYLTFGLWALLVKSSNPCVGNRDFCTYSVAFH